MDAYAQAKKNTVSAKGQLKETDYVKFEDENNSGKRVMFVGNSITLHGVLPEIGWHNAWGMAASDRSKDYVHLLETRIRKLDEDAAFCICQAARWEREYKDCAAVLPLFAAARDFAADMIVIRLVDNVPYGEYDAQAFRKSFKDFVSYLDATGNAKLVITNGFWRHPADGDLCDLAQQLGAAFVDIADLGEDDSMKAIGLFEHSGVANHPGDKGMQAIADRIFEKLKAFF